MAHSPAFALQSWSLSLSSFCSTSSSLHKASNVRVGRRPSTTSRPAHAHTWKRRVPQMQQETKQEPANASESSVEAKIQTSDSAVEDVINAGDSTAATESVKPAKKRYTLQTRLREETEAPFRKARMFVYGGSAVSAGVGSFIAGLRIIAALIGISGTQPLSETVPNVAINLTVVGLCSFLLRGEVRAGERRLERMSRGALIAGLRVEDAATRQVFRLKDLRGRSRVVLVGGTAEKVMEAMSSAEVVKEGLSRSNLLVIPYIVADDSTTDVSLQNWRLTPYGDDEWRKWFEGERDVAKARLGPKAEEVLVIIIRLDGKVGARSVGTPTWTKLVDEIAKMPGRDQYGKP